MVHLLIGGSTDKHRDYRPCWGWENVGEFNSNQEDGPLQSKTHFASTCQGFSNFWLKWVQLIMNCWQVLTPNETITTLQKYMKGFSPRLRPNIPNSKYTFQPCETNVSPNICTLCCDCYKFINKIFLVLLLRRKFATKIPRFSKMI